MKKKLRLTAQILIAAIGVFGLAWIVDVGVTESQELEVGKIQNISDESCKTHPGIFEEKWEEHLDFLIDRESREIDLSRSNDSVSGNIAILSATGILTESNSIDPLEASRRFYSSAALTAAGINGDVYDFILFWPNFNHNSGSFHIGVRNDITGIGRGLGAFGSLFGAPNGVNSTLNSINIYSNFVNFPANPNVRLPGNNDSTMSLIAQEVGHRWGAFVTTGNPNVEMRGRGLSHWSFFLNAPSDSESQGGIMGSSSLEGNEWVNNNNGTFTINGWPTDGYSELDRYLQGFATASQVPPFYLITNSTSIFSASSTPRGHLPPVTIDGTWTTVTIQDIINNHGVRNAGSEGQENNLRMAFVMIVQTDAPSAADIAKLDNIRTNWTTYFAASTNNVGAVNSTLVSGATLDSGVTVTLSHPKPGSKAIYRTGDVFFCEYSIASDGPRTVNYELKVNNLTWSAGTMTLKEGGNLLPGRNNYLVEPFAVSSDIDDKLSGFITVELTITDLDGGVLSWDAESFTIN